MQRKRFGEMECPVARSLERVGEWWSILILRDAFYGTTRFDDFQTALGVAPTILARRLKALVEGGLLERRKYLDRPARYDYVLTERGRDFRPVLFSLVAWGNRHFAPEGLTIDLRDGRTGEALAPGFMAVGTGRPVPMADVKVIAGPAATEGVRRKLARRSAAQQEGLP